jgi:hypothetical protein
VLARAAEIFRVPIIALIPEVPVLPVIRRSCRRPIQSPVATTKTLEFRRANAFTREGSSQV